MRIPVNPGCLMGGDCSAAVFLKGTLYHEGPELI